ncbi:hypothetical protein GR250_04480 [Rhizobium leguminosarum]|nr:hypothetical protein [Rhizobium leguminosarum]
MLPPDHATDPAARSQMFGHPKQTTLGEIDSFIPTLPREYQAYAHLIRSTAIYPEYALLLHVNFVEDLWQRHGFVRATRLLSSIPPSDVAPYLLVTEIRGRRKQTLRRNRVAADSEPPNVFLDYKARPITIAMANAAFARASKRNQVHPAITPALIRESVLLASLAEPVDSQIGDIGEELNTGEMEGET